MTPNELYKQQKLGEHPTRRDLEKIIDNIEDEQVQQEFKNKFTKIRTISMKQYRWLYAMMYNDQDQLKTFINNIK